MSEEERGTRQAALMPRRGVGTLQRDGGGRADRAMAQRIRHHSWTQMVQRVRVTAAHPVLQQVPPARARTKAATDCNSSVLGRRLRALALPQSGATAAPRAHLCAATFLVNSYRPFISDVPPLLLTLQVD